MIEWLKANARLKVAAVALAAVTWFFVKGITSEQRIVEGVPLDIRVNPPVQVLERSATALNVTVRGTREDVRQVSRMDMTAVMDLTREQRLGEFERRVRLESVRAPARVQVVQVEPATVTVRIDQMVSRELPVEAEFAGELPPGWMIEEVRIRPEKVRIQAPSKLLSEVTTLKTLPIDLAGRRTTFRERVEVAPLQPGEGPAQRRWVDAFVKIGEARPIDNPPRPGVEGQP